MTVPTQIQLEPMVVLNQERQLAEIDRETRRNHILLMAQREYDLTLQNAHQAEMIDRLRKAVEIALLLPQEAANEAPEVAALRQQARGALAPAAQPAASAEEMAATPPPEKTEAEQLEALRRHAMGED
ncbi:hypothetical protein [Mesorhizobium sp.]|uniref:hypothetical protein n=1 Tax=Mesorhizobium sp. TaxID=1871066 RepID=UPI000FE9AC6A|nr:hypothetical protein [Mesorhizobium sp.]RWC58934.1 MAG: hypothetical protein EOS56_18670 [Mesorhizobium sp.]RWC66546.1 MAG: hypothetical protein EOS29_04025 [Mesorhizobium sp.]